MRVASLEQAAEQLPLMADVQKNHLDVAGVMEAGGLVYVHSSKGYCGSTRTGPRALHQLVRSKNSNTCCLYFLLLLKLLQRGLAPISQGKCGSPPMKVKLTELSISDLRHAIHLTSESRQATQSGAHILSRCLRDVYALQNHFLP